MDNLITIIVALFGGGAIGTIIASLIGKKKTDAEAENTNIKSILEIDERMNSRLVKLEERVAHLEEENYKLKKDNLEKDMEITNLKAQLSNK